jgi:gentisate 1,2-dioxygenase
MVLTFLFSNIFLSTLPKHTLKNAILARKLLYSYIFGLTLTFFFLKKKSLSEECDWKFPWAPVQEALDGDKSAPYAVYTYLQKDGSPISKIIGAEAERIGANSTSPTRQETISRVFHVYDGQGYSKIEDVKGNVKILNWSRSDTFAVPSWCRITHHNEHNEPTYLFSYSDKPLLENLGLYKSAN